MRFSPTLKETADAPGQVLKSNFSMEHNGRIVNAKCEIRRNAFSTMMVSAITQWKQPFLEPFPSLLAVGVLNNYSPFKLENNFI